MEVVEPLLYILEHGTKEKAKEGAELSSNPSSLIRDTI